MRILTLMVLYGVLAFLPLGVVLIQPAPAGRAVWVELAVALGFIGFQQVVIQFMLVGRFQILTRPYGIDVVLSYHRLLGTAAIIFLTAHPLVLLWSDSLPWSLLDRVNLSGFGSLLALALLALFSFRRVLFRLSYENWRLLHAALGIAALVFGTLHIHWVGVYVNSFPKLLFFLASALLGTAFLLYLRVAKPLMQQRRPYRIVKVAPERGSTWLLTVEPEGHPGFNFEAGQFAWLKVAGTPFVLDEHPLSFSSSAEDVPRIEFAVKEQGDWSSQVGKIPIGATAFLDGPHGSISIERQQAESYTLIAGGIGIAPMMSILRTLKDRNDKRSVRVIYGNRNRQRTAFYEELEELREYLDLQVTHVFHEPQEDWGGLTGFIDPGILKKVIKRPEENRVYFICGPKPMVEMVGRGLQSLGVSEKQIFAERFTLV